MADCHSQRRTMTWVMPVHFEWVASLARRCLRQGYWHHHPCERVWFAVFDWLGV